MTDRTRYLLAVAVAIGAALFLVLGAGALGIIRDGGKPDLMYVAVLGVGLAVSTVSRFRPPGMVVALAVTAAGTLLVAVVAIAAGLHDGDIGAAVDIVAVSGMYAALFLLSAWLFRGASRGVSR